jgi:hypothetical protein
MPSRSSTPSSCPGRELTPEAVPLDSSGPLHTSPNCRTRFLRLTAHQLAIGDSRDFEMDVDPIKQGLRDP